MDINLTYKEPESESETNAWFASFGDLIEHISKNNVGTGTIELSYNSVVIKKATINDLSIALCKMRIRRRQEIIQAHLNEIKKIKIEIEKIIKEELIGGEK